MFGLSLILALVVGAALDLAGLVRSPVLAAVILTATSLGLVLPTIHQGGRVTTEFGQLVFAGATLGNLVSALLLSLLFSRDTNDVGTRVVLLGGFAVTVAVLVLALDHRRASMPVSRLLVRLQDTSAQVRVRGAMFLLLLLVLAAQEFGLAAILGAFVAGAVLSVLDRDGVRTHPLFRVKLDAVGYGFVIPVFMVAAGLSFDLDALIDEPSVLVRVPALPARVVARPWGAGARVPAGARDVPVGRRGTAPGDVAAVHRRRHRNRAVARRDHARHRGRFVTAGLLSALLFPLVADALLRAE